MAHITTRPDQAANERRLAERRLQEDARRDFLFRNAPSSRRSQVAARDRNRFFTAEARLCQLLALDPEKVAPAELSAARMKAAEALADITPIALRPARVRLDLGQKALNVFAGLLGRLLYGSANSKGVIGAPSDRVARRHGIRGGVDYVARYGQQDPVRSDGALSQAAETLHHERSEFGLRQSSVSPGNSRDGGGESAAGPAEGGTL